MTLDPFAWNTVLDMHSFESIQRPQRWDVPYSEDMTDVDVQELLGVEPFRSIDRKKFRGKFSLEGILKNDSRLMRFEKGDIVVRQGDWGNSAFFVISGSLQANLEGPEDLPTEILGRQPVKASREPVSCPSAGFFHDRAKNPTNFKQL